MRSIDLGGNQQVCLTIKMFGLRSRGLVYNIMGLVRNAAARLCLLCPAGSTYNPDQGEIQGLPSVLDTCLTHIAEVCAACNESKIECVEGTFRAVGAPTEASLKVN